MTSNRHSSTLTKKLRELKSSMITFGKRLGTVEAEFQEFKMSIEQAANFLIKQIQNYSAVKIKHAQETYEKTISILNFKI